MKIRAALLLTCLLVLAFASGTRAAENMTAPLGQPAAPYPTDRWQEYALDDPLRIAVEAAIAPAFAGTRPPALMSTRAIVVIAHGRLVAERYSQGITANTRLQSWSASKSFLHAAVGVAIGDGKLDPDAPAAIREWSNSDDARRAITARHLATMTDGLYFREDYGNLDSEVVQMLFGSGRGDVGAYAASSRLAHTPGTHWSYSSGSANVLSRVLRDALGGREAYAAFLRERLFKPLGMGSAVAEFDAAGTWIASSYLHATARDYAKFGLLYLKQGFWEDRQLVPRAWVESASQTTAESNGRYGTLFWLNRRNPATGKLAMSDKLPEDLYRAQGFGAEVVAIVPSHDLVIVMLAAAYGPDIEPIFDLFADVVRAAH